MLALAILFSSIAFSAGTISHGSISMEKALELSMGSCSKKRETIYLTKEQSAKIKEIAGTEQISQVVVRYFSQCPPAQAAQNRYAYLDQHIVRTKPQTLLVVLDAQGSIDRVEVISFLEPAEYLAKPAWYGQFKGKKLSPSLSLKKEIAPITGATLTARGTLEASRRMLALHQILGTP